MKTRVISTEIWDEDKVFSLNIDTKLLYLVLLTNPYIGQTRFYKINDRQLSTFSGLNVEQLQKCKRDLEESRMAYFKEGWVCITGYGFVECFYKGTKNEVAKQLELNKIPRYILTHFKEKLDSLSIAYPYAMDTPINNKLEIINNKLEILDIKSTEKIIADSTSNKQQKDVFSEFKNVKLTPDELNKLKDKFGEQDALVLIDELGTYLASTGKRYASHYATLLNWGRRKGTSYKSKKITMI